MSEKERVISVRMNPVFYAAVGKLQKHYSFRSKPELVLSLLRNAMDKANISPAETPTGEAKTYEADDYGDAAGTPSAAPKPEGE